MRWIGGLSLVLGALLWAQGTNAQRQLKVAVPGLQATDGDDDVANELTGWLRAGTTAVQGWQLHPTTISLEQHMLVHQCESVDESCLSKIAKVLDADRLISGALRRVHAEGGGGYDFQADLFYFNGTTGTIEQRAGVSIPKSKSTPEELAVIGQVEAQAFADAPLDQLGQAQALNLMRSRDPEFRVQPAALEPQADWGDRFPVWPAAVSYSGSLVFFGLSAWSWSTIRSVEDDPAFQRARLLAGPEVSNVCTAGTNFGVEELGSLCSKADRHETLQWVFVSMGVASAGVGTWLLVKSVRSKRRSEPTRVEVTPVAGKQRGGIRARLEF